MLNFSMAQDLGSAGPGSFTDLVAAMGAVQLRHDELQETLRQGQEACEQLQARVEVSRKAQAHRRSIIESVELELQAQQDAAQDLDTLHRSRQQAIEAAEQAIRQLEVGGQLQEGRATSQQCRCCRCSALMTE
jgi:chromosome segregation ATPase